MKQKILFFIAALALTATIAVAQDTIHTTTPPENYFYNYWHHYKPGDTVFCDAPLVYGLNYKGITMFSVDTITIYGIAIAAIIEYPDPCYDSYTYDSAGNIVPDGNRNGYYDGNGNWHLIGDSALDESYMDFVVMQVGPGAGNVSAASDNARLHMKYDTIAYYVDQDFIHQFPLDRTCKPLPVYEVYFRKPANVIDKFYIGGYNHSDERCIHDHPMYPEICMRGWGNGWLPTTTVCHWTYPNDEWTEYPNQPWQWFFPILTPNPDTTIYVPDDSTHVDDSTQTLVRPASWEHFVSLQPNPATGLSQILSSFDLTDIEVFDMSGQRVLRQEASGLATKLDVSTLPRGSYIVRINTIMGTTSRKLLLQ